jgi:putative ABC transport system ATP-binding protein
MILSVNNLEKVFKQGALKVEAVKGVSFDLEEGKSLSIIGPSGSGKSTLLSLISGLDGPTNGSVKVAGVDITKLSEKELSEYRSNNIGIVFQQFHLMPHLTALENVSLPLEIKSGLRANAEALKILDQVGLKDRANHLPSELSGGEKQRVAIARALVTRPKILLADEPSGNLDSETGAKVMNLLFNVCKESNISLVLITHDLKLSEKCDEQIKIQDGRLV